jgi:hypothetical protein
MPDGPDRVRQPWAAVGEFFEQCPVFGVIVRILQSSSTIRMPGSSGVHSAGAAPRAMPIRSPRSESAPAKRRDRPRPASPRAYPWLRTRSPHVLGGLRARRGDRCRCSVFFPARPRNRICWLARNPRPLRLSCTKASLLGLRRWPTAGSSLRGMAQTRMSPGSPRLTAAIIYQSLDAPL